MLLNSEKVHCAGENRFGHLSYIQFDDVLHQRILEAFYSNSKH